MSMEYTYYAAFPCILWQTQTTLRTSESHF